MPRKKKQSKKQRPVIVNLGCNRRPIKGLINVDMEPFPGVDVVTNLELGWPWKTSSVDHFVAFDLIEHLHDPIHTMNEAWRCLRGGGVFEILVPSTDGRGAWQDPTHVSFWNESSFSYYRVDRDTDGNWRSCPLRSIYAPHAILAAFEVEACETIEVNGIIYVKAKLIAVKDQIYTGQGLPEMDDRIDADSGAAKTSRTIH